MSADRASFPTRADTIEYGIKPALFPFTARYDVAAIFEDLWRFDHAARGFVCVLDPHSRAYAATIWRHAR